MLFAHKYLYFKAIMTNGMNLKHLLIVPFQVGVRRDVVTRRQAGDFTEARIDNRKSCDFSPSPKRYQQLPPSHRPLAPTKSAQISFRPGGGSPLRGGGATESDLLRGRLQLQPYSPPPLPTPHGLGRRAVTQLDFGRSQRNNPNNFDRVMAAPRLMQQQQQYHGGSQYLNSKRAAAAAGEGLIAGPYSSDSEFTAQRARRPHVLLHKEQPMMRVRRPSQVRERERYTSTALNLNLIISFLFGKF